MVNSHPRSSRWPPSPRARAQSQESDTSATTKPLHGGEWLSYEDHRMATAGAIIGLRVPGVLIENIGTTAKTLPEFARLWRDMVEPRTA